MKKLIKIILMVAVLFALAACGTANDNANGEDTTVLETPAPAPHPSLIPAPVDPNAPPQIEQRPDLFPDLGYRFTLTAEEDAVYQRLLTELSTDVFEGLSPTSVIKVYINAGINGEAEAEWNTFSPVGRTASLGEWVEMSRIDELEEDIASRRSMANIVFGRIDEGIELERDGRAIVVFYSVPDPDELEDDPDFPGVLHTFSTLRNDRGIWEVMFIPHAMDDFVVELLNDNADLIISHFGLEL